MCWLSCSSCNWLIFCHEDTLKIFMRFLAAYFWSLTKPLKQQPCLPLQWSSFQIHIFSKLAKDAVVQVVAEDKHDYHHCQSLSCAAQNQLPGEHYTSDHHLQSSVAEPIYPPPYCLFIQPLAHQSGCSNSRQTARGLAKFKASTPLPLPTQQSPRHKV